MIDVGEIYLTGLWGMTFGERMHVDGQEEASKQDQAQDIGKVRHTESKYVINIMQVITRLCHKVFDFAPICKSEVDVKKKK